MTALTLTASSHSPRPGMKIGAWSGQSGYTSNFGFNTLVGVCVNCTDDDTIVTTAISTGSATLTFINDAGSETTSTTMTGTYIAWGY